MYDIERDGSVGSQSISATVTVNEDPNNFTCPLPTSQYFHEFFPFSTENSLCTDEVEVEGEEVLSAGKL